MQQHLHQANLKPNMKSSLEIIPIAAFKDNYIWLLRYGSSVVVVDPGDATPVIDFLKKYSLNLKAILITHHHDDHVGGVKALLKYQSATVYAPQHSSFDFEHVVVGEQDQVVLPEIKQQFTIMALPGHTLSHIAYVNKNYLFCGDTLFGAGCGRLFEGTPKQMYDSLQRLAALPASTAMYCAHEYTEHNIKFALTLEPDNQALIKRKIDSHHMRLQALPTLPSSIDLELNTNPFLRCNQASIISNSHAQSQDVLSVFSQIRALRNHY